jgi:hypothetical protein
VLYLYYKVARGNLKKENKMETIKILCANVKCQNVLSSVIEPTCGQPECLEYWVEGVAWLEDKRAKSNA